MERQPTSAANVPRSIAMAAIAESVAFLHQT
jgi:hypothetical protein